jgi:hypothetical protein
MKVNLELLGSFHPPSDQSGGGDDSLDPRWIGAVIPRGHWHFHRELHARYAIVLGPGEFSMIVSAIKSGRALLIERRNARQAIYSIRVPSAGERVYILASGSNLISAWPPERRLNRLRRALNGQRASAEVPPD